MFNKIISKKKSYFIVFKGIQRLIESLPLLKEKIHYKPVLTALQSIIEQTKKKADTKAVCIELEEKIQELLEAKDNEMTDSHLMPPPSTVPRNKRSIRRSRRKSTSDEDEDSSDDTDEEDADNISVVKCEFEIDIFSSVIVCVRIITYNITSYDYAQR